jgi:excisionase family DNA binding protein
VRDRGPSWQSRGDGVLHPREALDAALAHLDDLDAEDLPTVLGVLEEAKARCWARLTAPPPPSRRDEPSQLLTVREAAARLGLSADYLYRHKRKLPFMQHVGTRTIRCPEAALARWVAAQRRG